jgi:hypothetical protein
VELGCPIPGHPVDFLKSIAVRISLFLDFPEIGVKGQIAHHPNLISRLDKTITRVFIMHIHNPIFSGKRLII